jgi:hypothetical protein
MGETVFDPGLPQRLLWFNVRHLGFCNSSDYSSLGVGVEDFADYFVDVSVASVQIPAASRDFDEFSFHHIDVVECFTAFKSITFNAVGVDGISVRFIKLLLPLIFVMCCMFSIILSPLLFFLLCERWLLFGRLLRLVHLSNFCPITLLVLFLFYLRRLNAFSIIRWWSMSMFISSTHIL